MYATWFPHPLPDEAMPGLPHIDKLIHAVMFGGLAGALMFDYYRNGGDVRVGSLTVRTVMVAAIVAAAFGVVDEVVQGLLPNGRHFEAADLLADIVGIIIAVFTAPPAVKAILRPRR